MQVELVTDAVRLSECTAGWDALADELHQPRAGGSMVTAWARHMMDPSSELRIWLATEGSQVIGVLPFVAEPLPRGRQRLLPPAATFLYGITPIARPDRERAAAEALVGELARASAALDIVGVDCMPPRSPWAEAITGALNGPEWVALDPVRHNLPYVDLQEGLDGWLSRRQSKFKRELRRRARIQEAEGFRLFCTAEPEEIINRLPAVRALYNERQREGGAPGIDSM